MPQIWLTYDELAALMDCDTTSARVAAVTIPLDRRKSRDGNTRVKLSFVLADEFIDRAVRLRTGRTGGAEVLPFRDAQ